MIHPPRSQKDLHQLLLRTKPYQEIETTGCLQYLLALASHHEKSAQTPPNGKGSYTSSANARSQETEKNERTAIDMNGKKRPTTTHTKKAYATHAHVCFKGSLSIFYTARQIFRLCHPLRLTWDMFTTKRKPTPYDRLPSPPSCVHRRRTLSLSHAHSVPQPSLLVNT